MAKTIGIGHSLAKNPLLAGREAARQALEQLSAPGQCHSCLVFATVGYRLDILLQAIREEIGPVTMAGCSGEGIIAPGVADESNHSVLVIALADPRLTMHTASCSEAANSEAAGRSIGRTLREQAPADARCILVFPCGLYAAAVEFVSALEQTVGQGLPIIGGMSADNNLRLKTSQFHDWRILEGGVSAALLSGPFRVLTDVSHGCVPFGTEMEVTRAESTRLYEINGKPAMDVMVEYVGEKVRSNFGVSSLHFCLGQESDRELSSIYDPFIIRYIARYHPEDNSISLPIKMKAGDRLWLTRRDTDKIIQAAATSIGRIREELSGKIPFLVLHFDCVGRGKAIFSELDKLALIKSFQDNLLPHGPWGGFFTLGEFSPVGTRNLYHNFSVVLALFVWEHTEED